MPKFVTIGYGDQVGYDSTPAAVREAAHAHDTKLRKTGVLMGVAGNPAKYAIRTALSLRRRLGRS
jgi:hypothetical protein